MKHVVHFRFHVTDFWLHHICTFGGVGGGVGGGGGGGRGGFTWGWGGEGYDLAYLFIWPMAGPIIWPIGAL